jgi:hypothetical protein
MTIDHDDPDAVEARRAGADARRLGIPRERNPYLLPLSLAFGADALIRCAELAGEWRWAWEHQR